MITSSVEKQDGLGMRLLTASCEKMFGWLLKPELSLSPGESLMFMTYHSVGWEEALMYQSLARIQQIGDEGVYNEG